MRAPKPPLSELSILASYHYHRKPKFKPVADAGAMLFADSGAFSAYSSGVPISLDEYASWLRRHSHRWHIAASLDVIHDPIATWRNTAALRLREIPAHRLLPTLHLGADAKWLAKYAERGHNYIALGGLQSATQDEQKTNRRKWIDRCFVVAEKHGIGLHGFAVTDFRLLTQYPWRSCDSSTFAVVGRFGHLTWYDEHRHRWFGQRAINPANLMPHRESISRFGVNIAQLAKRHGDWHHQGRIVIVQSFLALQNWMRKHRRSDFRVFFACGSSEIEKLIDSANHQR